MPEKTLPEIYREAADLVLRDGKISGEMKAVREGRCLGYCTMGATFEAAGLLTDHGTYVNTVLGGVDDFVESDSFAQLARPIADRIVSSARRRRVEVLDGEEVSPGVSAFWTIAKWNDQDSDGKPTAEDVAKLLRETADAVEKAEAK